ncbi:MAG: hypothetical protein AB7T10_09225 [bacterium]
MLSENIKDVVEIAEALKETKRKVCLVGGAISSFYLEDDVSSKIRPTKDVDCVIEVLDYLSFMDLEKSLKKLGFVHDLDSGIICRWKYGQITVDIIPSESKKILGFTNIWYKEGMKNSISKEISGVKVHYFPLCYYIASKIEAFKSRGKNDYYDSNDFEDIVLILEGRRNLNEFYGFPQNVIAYLKREFGLMLQDTRFESAVYGHLEQTPVIQRRFERIIGFLKEFVKKERQG